MALAALGSPRVPEESLKGGSWGEPLDQTLVNNLEHLGLGSAGGLGFLF